MASYLLWRVTCYGEYMFYMSNNVIFSAFVAIKIAVLMFLVPWLLFHFSVYIYILNCVLKKEK